MAYTFDTKLISVAENYIKILNAKVTKSTLVKTITENPYYPSLYSLSQTFNKFGIPNNAYKISAKDFEGYEITTPFIAFVKFIDQGEDFVLVTGVNESTINYLDKNNKTKSISKNIFLNKSTGTEVVKQGDFFYKGILWFAEINEQSGEVDYYKVKTEERKLLKNKVLVIIGCIVVIFYLLKLNISSYNVIQLSILFFIKGIGVVTSSVLLVYEIFKNHAFVKNICSLNRKTNCDAILSSKASKIAGIGWGEIGFYYFSSTVIGLLIPTISYEIKITWIAIANICAAPYIFFSIYYQWKVIKQWCVLCLTIQIILASELLWSIFNVWMKHPVNVFTFSSVLSVIFCLLIPILLWYLAKPYLTKSKDHDLYKSAYKRLQYNPDIFNTLLEQQNPVPNGWQTLGIDIGDQNAKNTLIKICNPYCKPCDKAHPILENIIANRKDIKLKIIFVTSNHFLDKGLPVVKHLLSIATTANEKTVQEALDDWYLYVDKDYDVFKEKYKKYEKINEQSSKVEAMRRWCDTANITYTPTIFINGFLLPENYNIDELTNII